MRKFDVLFVKWISKSSFESTIHELCYKFIYREISLPQIGYSCSLNTYWNWEYVSKAFYKYWILILLIFFSQYWRVHHTVISICVVLSQSDINLYISQANLRNNMTSCGHDLDKCQWQLKFYGINLHRYLRTQRLCEGRQNFFLQIYQNWITLAKSNHTCRPYSIESQFNKSFISLFVKWMSKSNFVIYNFLTSV